MERENMKDRAPISALVRRLEEAELPAAKRIFHLAFGTFLGLPDPMQFSPDRDYVRGRFHANREGALCAEAEGEFVGSNFVSRWGSVGFFGPLTIRPDFWDRGVATRLVERAVELFDQWGTRHAGLFTFPDSIKHLHLYEKFGFWPRFLTAVMSLEIRPRSQATACVLYSELSEGRRTESLKASGELTDSVYEGLDLHEEIRVVDQHKLGDTLFVWENSRLAAFGVCHCGPGTEAGEGGCYVKFGAARSAQDFERLLNACEAFAARRGLAWLEAGVNTARHDAYRRMLARDFRTRIQGVAMHKPNESGYSRPDVYVLDDWR
jgi:GNAT superfamily N-acetyltransferase